MTRTKRTENAEFVPKARIILQLGDQLIRSESIAVLEIIKNAYDACAKNVKIRMSDSDKRLVGEIMIEDDGHGMSFEIVRDVWLQPGTTFKKNRLEGKEDKNNKDDKTLCGRTPLGEKGIGRFGVHKLGEEIEMITREKDNDEEVHLRIEWNRFDNDLSLAEVKIKLDARDPEEFKGNKHGTKIIIRKLRSNWTRGAVRDLYRAVNSLNSPFESLDDFRIKFRTDKPEWLDGLLKFKAIEQSALFEATATIQGSQIKELSYDFKPWESMKDLRPRNHVETDIAMMQKVFNPDTNKREMRDIDLADYQIGEVKIRLLIFDFDTNILSLGVSDKKGLKDYLKFNGGIRVYREGVRVYDYGEPGNDWLNLDMERVNLPTARISNNIVIGAVYLNRLQSRSLEEKTNREGFIENDAYREFLSAIRFTVSRVVVQRNIDKDKLRSHYGNSGRKVPVTDNLEILKTKITESISQQPLKEELLETIRQIEDDYKTITEIYVRSASAGLSLSIVIHEIEKIISEMMQVIESTTTSDRIQTLTKHLGKLIDGYSGLIKRRSRKQSDLRTVVNDALWNIEFRLIAHKVEIIKGYTNAEAPFSVRCSESLVIGTIVNIIDNSIWWLNYGKVQHKKIFINITDELPPYTTIVIADNGPGFSLPTEDIVKPFISNREDGMGIGLHLAYEIMNGHGGELMFPSPDQFTVPVDFRSGAIIALAFKKD